jgi:hypothetical protein
LPGTDAEFQSVSRSQKGSLPWAGRRGPCPGPATNVSKCFHTSEGVLARDRRQMFLGVSRPQKGSLPETDDKCFQVSQDPRRGPCPRQAEGVLAQDRLLKFFLQVPGRRRGPCPGPSANFKVSQDPRRGPCPGPTANFVQVPDGRRGPCRGFPENVKLGIIAFALATLPWGPGW